MREFLNMGGYAAYVWPCFALAGVVLAWNVLAARRLHAAARARARADGDRETGFMTPRRKRMLAVVAILAGVGAAVVVGRLQGSS